MRPQTILNGLKLLDLEKNSSELIDNLEKNVFGYYIRNNLSKEEKFSIPKPGWKFFVKLL